MPGLVTNKLHSIAHTKFELSQSRHKEAQKLQKMAETFENSQFLDPQLERPVAGITFAPFPATALQVDEGA
jgi:hypothetical protein